MFTHYEIRQASAAVVLLISTSLCRAQHLDVLTQVSDGKIAIGAADYDNNTWTIGKRVFERQLLSNFRVNEPGFTGLATGNSLLESGVSGFPANHDVFFDLLPMRIAATRSNVFFWDGTDLGGNGLTLDDVQFVPPPAGVTWNLLDDAFNLFTADGTDAFVSGGLVQQTSSDTDPGDGLDTGTLHSHLLLRVDDGDGNTQTTPPQGVYMAALQLRAADFETSDPFLFVHRTSTLSNEIRDLAAQWADLNYKSMFAAPGDYDLDGDVDQHDFLEWRRAFGAVGMHAADGNGNGIVDAADYVVWRNNYAPVGRAAASGSSYVVPEPAAVVLLISSLLLLATRARRRYSPMHTSGLAWPS